MPAAVATVLVWVVKLVALGLLFYAAFGCRWCFGWAFRSMDGQLLTVNLR